MDRTPHQRGRNLSPIGAAPQVPYHRITGDNHLRDTLELACGILDRYKRERRLITPEEKALLHRINEFTGLPVLPTEELAHSPEGSRRVSVEDEDRDNVSRVRNIIKNIKRVAELGTVYKQVMNTRDDLDSITQFSLACAKLTKDKEELSQLIAGTVQSICDRTLKKDVVVFLNTTNAELLENPITGEYIEPHGSSIIAQCWSSKTVVKEGNKTAMPLISEGTCVGVVGIQGEVQEDRVGIVEAHHSIAAMSVRNLDLLEDLKWQAGKAEAMLQMANRLSRDNLDEKVLSASIIETAKQLTEADRGTIFLVKGEALHAYFQDGRSVIMGIDTGIAGHVAKTGEIVNIRSAYADPRFNAAVDKATGYHTETILCMPVYYEGAIVAVAQLINKMPYKETSGRLVQQYFNTRDEELFATFSTFVGVSLRNCRINAGLIQEKQKSQAILDVVTLLSNTDIRDVNAIVSHVMLGARKLLNADRASLFLVDKERNELYSEVADSTGGQQIRFPSGRGIAGSVAATGQPQNIRDAYADDRFNRDIDKQLGYRTYSILCEPIALNGEVLAVAQLVNKLENDEVSLFSEDDEATFRTFALFAGISISNSHLLQFAVRAGQEAMALNNVREHGPRGSPRTDDIAHQLIQPEEREKLDEPDLIPSTVDITSNKFSLLGLREASGPKRGLDAAAAVAVNLIWSTGLPEEFGCTREVLANFVLQCRRRYRTVPYHNFYHAVDVCQTVYTFLYTGGAKEYLTHLEVYVLLITALVHDLDHMGVNNSFHLKTDSPLGILSSASGNNSVLEVHHCNLAIEILDDLNANVFGGIADRAHAYKAMIDAVLATDMARHVEIMNNFGGACDLGFDKDNSEHRTLLMQMVLKAADISNVTKPFNLSRQWAMNVTEEFYQQGDKEKAKGVEVLPMFDRSQNNELAKGQIGFINFVAFRFFSTIVTKLLSGMQWTTDTISDNKDKWQAILDGGSPMASISTNVNVKSTPKESRTNSIS